MNWQRAFMRAVHGVRKPMRFRLQLCDARTELAAAGVQAPKSRTLGQPCRARTSDGMICGCGQTTMVKFDYPNRRAEWRCKQHSERY